VFLLSVGDNIATRYKLPTREFFYIKMRNHMNQVTKFYLKQAVYQVEIDGVESAMLLDYSGNKYEVIGNVNAKIEEIAHLMLRKKHNINFAYKFDGKINEEKL
jgi:hypothetical protein